MLAAELKTETEAKSPNMLGAKATGSPPPANRFGGEPADKSTEAGSGADGREGAEDWAFAGRVAMPSQLAPASRLHTGIHLTQLHRILSSLLLSVETKTAILNRIVDQGGRSPAFAGADVVPTSSSVPGAIHRQNGSRGWNHQKPGGFFGEKEPADGERRAQSLQGGGKLKGIGGICVR